MIAEEKERRARLAHLQEAGINPYPARIERTHTLAEFLSQFSVLDEEKTSVDVVGRVRAIRKHGALSFIKLEDESGQAQAMVKQDSLGEEGYNFMSETLDVGDFVHINGVTIVTRTGESSVDAKSVQIISKALLPLPEKWHGLSDVETRFRHRELDLISNESVRAVFRARAAIVTAIRKFLDGRGFLEVDTPILQHVAAGANAKPFATHHNALDQEMYMRIAPELYLKRLVIGGFERVYEIARCFRNEGIDHAHNPEFSQVEAYVAYMDYEELMRMMEEMIRELILAIGKDASKIMYDGNELDFKSPFKRITYRDLIHGVIGLDVDLIDDEETARSAAKEHGVEIGDADSMATIIDSIFKKLVRPGVMQPTFVMDYPAAMTPLAKRKEGQPNRVEMFQLIVGGGFEVMKAFSELNDPVDQQERMEEQEKAHIAGDEEAQRQDNDFVYAMKHGMPPTAGVGMGIERITQVLTDSHNIKEVILFPTLRFKELDSEDDSEVL
ncbi:lysine--tRNA ligase [Candidatus Uhrbacteria bacterium]|nr:lysine--tRNA ligase [Candidatus Uhrbacteria bacterium]